MSDELEVFSRLSMLEFAVEVLMANALAENNEQYSAAFKEDFISRFSTPTFGSLPDCPEAEQVEAWIAERTSQMASKLIEKVASREKEIRGSKV